MKKYLTSVLISQKLYFYGMFYPFTVQRCGKVSRKYDPSSHSLSYAAFANM